MDDKEKIKQLKAEITTLKKSRQREKYTLRQKQKNAQRLHIEIGKARKRIEQLETALQRIDTWANAYPLDIFPEPDFKKVAEILKAAGLSLAAVTASNNRHVIVGVKNIVEEALKGE